MLPAPGSPHSNAFVVARYVLIEARRTGLHGTENLLPGRVVAEDQDPHVLELLPQRAERFDAV